MKAKIYTSAHTGTCYHNNELCKGIITIYQLYKPNEHNFIYASCYYHKLSLQAFEKEIILPDNEVKLLKIL